MSSIVVVGYFISSGLNAPQLNVENVNISISSDYPVFTELSDMSAKSDLIVTGKYVAYLSDWNMDRNPDNPKDEQSKTSYSVGKLYSFEINSAIKGGAMSDTITVNKAFSSEGAYTLDSGEILKYQIPSQYFIEPNFESQYVLFLVYDPLFERYHAIGEPWEILIEDDNSVNLKSNLFNAESNASSLLTAEAQQGNTLYKFSIGGSDIGRYSDFISEMSLDEIVAAVGE